MEEVLKRRSKRRKLPIRRDGKNLVREVTKKVGKDKILAPVVGAMRVVVMEEAIRMGTKGQAMEEMTEVGMTGDMVGVRNR